MRTNYIDGGVSSLILVGWGAMVLMDDVFVGLHLGYNNKKNKQMENYKELTVKEMKTIDGGIIPFIELALACLAFGYQYGKDEQIDLNNFYMNQRKTRKIVFKCSNKTLSQFGFLIIACLYIAYIYGKNIALSSH